MCPLSSKINKNGNLHVTNTAPHNQDQFIQVSGLIIYALYKSQGQLHACLLQSCPLK